MNLVVARLTGFLLNGQIKCMSFRDVVISLLQNIAMSYAIKGGGVDGSLLDALFKIER